MLVNVTCRCGRVCRLDTNDAGNRFQCPRCARMLTIPEAPAPKKEDAIAFAKSSSPPKKQAKQLDILEEVPDDPPPVAKKPRCTFCGSGKKVTTFRVWTARRGASVEIVTPNGEAGWGPSCRDLMGHEVPCCKACGRRTNRRYRRWQLWVTFVQLVIITIVTGLCIWVAVALDDERNALYLGKIIFADVLCLILFLGTLSNYFFGKTKLKHVEKAIAETMYQEIHPDATAGLSSAQMRGLQPKQIIGTPRWAKKRKET